LIGVIGPNTGKGGGEEVGFQIVSTMKNVRSVKYEL
jgi:hypothetical protein